MILPRVLCPCLAAALALAGCAAPAPHALAPEQRAQVLEQRSLDNARLNDFLGASGRPFAGTWDLDRLTLAALYFRPEMKVADAGLAVAAAGIETARERPNPHLDIMMQHASPLEFTSPWSVGATIGLLLELFHKRQDRTEAASALAEAARHDLDTAAWSVRGDVRAALLDAHASTMGLELARQQLAVASELAGLLAERLNLGAASSSEVAQAEAGRRQAELALSESQQRLAAARAVLAAAVGIPLSALPVTQIDDTSATGDPQVPDEGTLRTRALVDRADIQAALARYKAADAAWRLEVANRFPNVTLAPGFSYSQGQYVVGGDVGADLPVFNRNGGPIAEAAARARLAAAEFDALQGAVLARLDAALADYRSQGDRAAAADRLIATETLGAAMARRQFDAGRIDRTALLAEQSSLLAARQAELDAQTARQRALGALEDAAQTPMLGGFANLPAPPASPPGKDKP